MSYKFRDNDDNKDWMIDTKEKGGNEDEVDEEEDVEDDSKGEIDAMGQKLEEIKASLLIRYQKVSKKAPSYLVSVYQQDKGDEKETEESPKSEKSRESRSRRRKEKSEEKEEDEKKDVNAEKLDEPIIELTPEQQFNRRFNIVVGITLICVMGLGIGHFLGLTKCSLLESGLSADEIISKMDYENKYMEEEIKRLQSQNMQNMSPIKIKGRDGQESRQLREKITTLIATNEEMRLTITRLKFMTYADGDKQLFNTVSQQNLDYKVAMAKLIHLGPDLDELKESMRKLEVESESLGLELAQMRIQEQPIPRELNGVLKEIDKLKLIVREAARKKNPPANLANAKSYISLLSQVLSSITSMNEFKDGSHVERLEMVVDVFSQIAPKGSSLPMPIQDKVKTGRKILVEMRNSLAHKWDQLKKLTRPDTISTIGHTTLNKMNRVIVNVVNKVKEIGQALLMHRGKTSPDKTIKTLVDKLTVLDTQFEKTWETLETEIQLPEAVQERIADSELSETNEEMGTETTDDEEESSRTRVKQEKAEEENKRKIDKERNKEEIARGLEKANQRREDAKIREEKVYVKPEPVIPKPVIPKSVIPKPVIPKPKIEKPRPVKEEPVKEPPKRKPEREIKPKREERNALLVEEKEKPKKEFAKPVQKTDSAQPEGRYFKGMYNKYDKNKDGNSDESAPTPKIFDYDDEEDDDDDSFVQSVGKKSGIMKHWGKPQKKSFFREAAGPNKAFIPRRDG